MENTNQIKCRKCGGPHFTIKCGKEINNNNNIFSNNNEINIDIENNINDNINSNNKHKDNSKSLCTDNKKNNFKNKINRVKISQLPNDITEKEIMELTYDWGNIIKIKVLNYEEHTIVYLDFKYEDQADYFIKALHKTTFEYTLISVVRAESNDYYTPK
jgi:hypothetical protein|uniref:RRM domain-containing protein n=1 Tax=viral metagenome TaxID=1070528 RepID=A0A6C0EE27_9ZZZZ